MAAGVVDAVSVFARIVLPAEEVGYEGISNNLQVHEGALGNT